MPELRRALPGRGVALPRAPRAAGGGDCRVNLPRRRPSCTRRAGGLAALTESTPFSRLQGKQALIRPPGALPEGDFLRSCVRCGACMKSCPTNTLQPCLWEGGLAGLWSPKVEPRFAACDQHCNACGRVCPTQAIRSLPLEEKTHARIGTAVIRKEQCLVWAQDKLCLICDEICPYNAIVFRTIEGTGGPWSSVPLQRLRVLRGALPRPGRLRHRGRGRRGNPAEGRLYVAEASG